VFSRKIQGKFKIKDPTPIITTPIPTLKIQN